jgi:hypothetical protein
MAILRSAFPPAGLMTQLINRAGPDQPWVVASWAGVPGGTAERVYVMSNDGSPGQAAVQFSLDAATAAAPAGFGAPLNLQLRPGSSRPSVRGAIRPLRRIYIDLRPPKAGLSDIVVGADGAGTISPTWRMAATRSPACAWSAESSFRRSAPCSARSG